MNEKYILLAEDNENDVLLTRRVLKKYQIDYGLVVVSNGQQALDFLSSKDLSNMPSVVLLDIKLPLVDGIEVLRSIRAKDSTRLLPVIMLTASVDEKDKKESLRLGANDFQCKPVNYDEFVQLIMQISSKWLAN